MIRPNTALREARGNRLLKEVAADVGISIGALSHYENGRRCPEDHIKVKLAKYYGKGIVELFYEPRFGKM